MFSLISTPDYPLLVRLLLTCATPFAGRDMAGVVAAVITPPDTLSTVVPGLESWDETGTDFKEPSDIFISDVCPLGAAFEIKYNLMTNIKISNSFKNKQTKNFSYYKAKPRSVPGRIDACEAT